MYFDHQSFPHIIDTSTQWISDDRPKKDFDMSRLPSAPRAATRASIDPSRLPKSPPYTVFLGNLSYEVSEEDIENFFKHNSLSVSNIVHKQCFYSVTVSSFTK